MRDSTWDTIRYAIVKKQRISATYDGVSRILSPHALGEKDGRARALFLQSEPLRAGRSLADQWRCMDIDRLEDVVLWDDGWVTVGTHSRRSTCMDHVEIQITY